MSVQNLFYLSVRYAELTPKNAEGRTHEFARTAKVARSCCYGFFRSPNSAHSLFNNVEILGVFFLSFKCIHLQNLIGRSELWGANLFYLSVQYAELTPN